MFGLRSPSKSPLHHVQLLHFQLMIITIDVLFDSEGMFLQGFSV